MRNTRLCAAMLLAAYLPACASYRSCRPGDELKAPRRAEFGQVPDYAPGAGSGSNCRTPRVDGDSFGGHGRSAW